MYRRLAIASILTTLLAFGSALSAAPRGTITDIVAASGGDFDDNNLDFDILLNAVLAAELDGALDDKKARYTVFAPNDLAFIRLAQDLGFGDSDEEGAWLYLVDQLTLLGGGDPIPVLTDVLLFHVSPKKIGLFKFVLMAIFGKEIPTLLGAPLEPFLFGLRDNDPDLVDPRLTSPVNIRARNGRIHTIDRVLIPLDL